MQLFKGRVYNAAPPGHLMLKTILLIEDDNDTRDLLSRMLSAEGYAVRVAANGWEGLTAMEAYADLIILDIMLPRRISEDARLVVRRQRTPPLPPHQSFGSAGSSSWWIMFPAVSVARRSGWRSWRTPLV